MCAPSSRASSGSWSGSRTSAVVRGAILERARYPVTVRLWLKDSERRPDPAPVKTDDRKAMLVGIALWLVALVIVLAFALPLAQQNNGAVLWTCIAGLALGLIGLVYTHFQQKN